jgi:hypothetical protein
MCAIAAVLLAPALLTACTTATTPVTVHFTAFYFQTFYVPDVKSATPVVCATSGATQWYLYVSIEGIDNSAPDAVDFTFDPAKLQALYPTRDTEVALWSGYLDSYWQPEQVAVPAGQLLDSAHVHQGKFFQINYGAPMLSNNLPDIPPILYHTSSTPGPLLLASPHHVFPSPDAAQPTNQFLADVHDVPLVEAGSCTT